MTLQRCPPLLAGAFVFGCLVAVACGDGDQPQLRGQRTAFGADSVVVLNDAKDTPLTWVVDTAWVVGGELNSAATFYHVDETTVAASPESGIRVMDAMAKTLLSLDESGTVRWTAGQDGEGPGEFKFPGAVALDGSGDTHVYDWGKERITVFDLQGQYTREYSHEYGPLSPMWPHFRWVDGILYSWRRPPSTDTSQEIVVVRFGEKGVDTVAIMPDRFTKTIQQQSCSLKLGLPVAFVPKGRWASNRGTLALNVTPEYEVRMVWPDSTRTVRRAIVSTETTRDEALEYYGARLPNGPLVGGCRYSASDLVDGIGFYSHHQVIRRMAISPGGKMFVQRRDGRSDTFVIDVFLEDGTYEGTLPIGTPMPIGFVEEYGILFKVGPDQFDVERLGMGHLRWD